MATQTIRGLTPAVSITGDMMIPVAPSSGSDVSITVSQLSSFSIPAFYFAGGQFSYAGVSQLVVQPFAAADSTNSSLIYVSIPTTMNAFTIGPNGLDAGTPGGPLAANATYFVYAIGGNAGSALMFSENGSAPDFSSAPGYSVYLQIGYVDTDASGNFELSSVTNTAESLKKDNPQFTNILSGPDFIWIPGSSILAAGQGVDTANANSNNVLLGNFAETSFSGNFCWMDGSVTPGNVSFPSAANQFIVRSKGGVGFNTDSSGTTPSGPQAGYHFGAFYGTKPGFMFTTNAVVADANMQPYDVNPNVASDIFSIKYSGSSGTKSTLTFPSLGGGIPGIAANNIFTGGNSFSGKIANPYILQSTNSIVMGNGAAPLILPTSAQEVVCIGPGAGALIPNAPTNHSRSTFIGTQCAQKYTTSGGANDQHVGIGYVCLGSMTTASEVTAVGGEALFALTTGNFNAAFGNSAGSNLTTGIQNTLLGTFAATGAASGTYSNCTLVGYSCCSSISSSSNSVVVGANAGNTLSSGSNNLILGANSDVSSGTATNRIAIGEGVTASNDNQGVIGNSSLTSLITLGTASLGTSGNPWNGAFINGVSTLEDIQVTNGYVTDSMVFPAVETVYSTTSTILAADLLNKTLFCNPTAAITLTLPTGALFNAAFGAASPAVNTALEGISITNVSAFAITIAAGTGFTISGIPNPVIAALTTRFFKIRKSTSAPAFIMYG